MNKEKLLLDYIRYQSEADTYVDALNDIFENMNKYLEENGEEQLNRLIDNLKISLENYNEGKGSLIRELLQMQQNEENMIPFFVNKLL